MAGKQMPRWARALGLLVFPLRGIVSTGKMLAYALTLTAVSLAGVTVWARASLYHAALVVAGLMVVSGFVALMSLLKQVDDLSKVRTRVSITHAEVREHFPTEKLMESYRDISIAMVSTLEKVILRDALLVRFAINFRNDGEETGAYITEISLWQRRLTGWSRVRYREEYVRIDDAGRGPGDPLIERWVPSTRHFLPARKLKDVEVYLLANIATDDPRLYKRRLEFRITIDILGSGDRLTRIPLVGVTRTYPRPFKPSTGHPPSTASEQSPPP